jgi:hypothetical protein
LTTITVNGDDALVARYLKEHHVASRAFDDAIAMLVARKNGFADFAETQVINASLGVLQREAIDVRADFHAFLDERGTVVAPTQEDFEKIQALSRELAGMNANSNVATEIIRVATDIAQTFGNTQA